MTGSNPERGAPRNARESGHYPDYSQNVHWPGPPQWPGKGPWQGESAEESGEASNIDIAGLFRRYWLALICFVTLGIAAGFLAALYTSPAYKVRTMLELMHPYRSATQQQEFISDVEIQTNIQLLRSSTFIGQVMERLKTETVPPAPMRGDLFSRIRNRVKPGGKDPGAIMNEGLSAAVGSFDVRPINGTRLLEIRCDSTHPEIAANFVNTLAAEYISQNSYLYSQQSERTSKYSHGQLEQTKNTLNDAERRLQAFIRRSGNVFVSQDSGTLAETKLKQLQTELSISQKDRIEKQAKSEMVSKVPLDSIGEVLDDANLSSYQSKLNDLRREMAVLLTTYTSNHQKVKRLQVQIDELEATFRKEANDTKQRIRTDYEAALRRERLLSSAHSGTAGQVSSQTAQAAEYNTLKREVDIAAELYNSLLLQSSKSNLNNSAPPMVIRVVDRAVPPSEPYQPKPIANMALGAMGGMGLCVAIAVLREKLDRSIKGPEFARMLVNAPQLGVIPSIEGPRRGMKRLAGIPGFSLGGSTKMLTAPGVDMPDPSVELAAWNERPTAHTEAFRLVLAALLRMNPTGRQPKAVLFTSPGPGEGKTTIVGNLGMALAETHRRTIIVDADFRLPRIHKIFGIPNEGGLTYLLNGEPLTSARLDSAIVPTTMPHLFVLPNGPGVQNISRALYSAELRELILMLRQRFDTILIDAPPLLHAAEARVINYLTDGVVLVIRSGHTDRESTMRAYQCLREDGVVLLGSILNDWQPDNGMSSYYSYSQ